MDGNYPMGTVFSGLSALVVEDVTDSGDGVASRLALGMRQSRVRSRNTDGEGARLSPPAIGRHAGRRGMAAWRTVSAPEEAGRAHLLCTKRNPAPITTIPNDHCPPASSSHTQ